MADRIQLKEPGSELLMTVSSVKPEIVERNEYYLFANGKVELLVPQSSIKGRFERLGITAVEQMVGKAVRFARSTKMSRAGAPYWDIDWSSGAETSAGGEMGKPNTGTSASAPPAEPLADDRDKALLRERSIYAVRMRQAFAYVLDDIEPICKQKEIGLTGEDVYKTAYSLWQSWINAGIIK